MPVKLKKISLPQAFWVALALLPGLAVILYYLVGPAGGYMTSDCTDSIRWAQATFESGRLISPDFSYAAILPFGGNIIFLPFIAIFGYSMTSQILGLVLFALLFMGALYYLARGLDLSPVKSGLMVSLAVLLLSSSPKLREIIWEHIFYYNLGLLFFCLGFGLILRLTRRQENLTDFSHFEKRDWVRLACLILFSFLAATDGLQTLVCLTLPVLGAFGLEYFFIKRETTPGKKKLGLLTLLCLVLFWSLLGFIMIPFFSGGVEAGYANAYSTYSDMGSWKDNFLSFFHHWLTLFGVSVADRDPLVSMDSVMNMLRIACAYTLLILPFVLLLRYQKQEERELRLLMGGHLFVSAFILFATTFGNLGRADWRLTPMLGTSVLVCLCWGFKRFQIPALRRYGAVFLALFVFISALNSWTVLRMAPDYGSQDSWNTAARALKSRGLRYGYANFWWAEKITLLSADQVQVANINESNGKPAKNDYQLPAGSFDDRETDAYFLLLTESEQKKMASWLSSQTKEGRIRESFQIPSEPYDLRGYNGSILYVYVFYDNIF